MKQVFMQRNYRKNSIVVICNIRQFEMAPKMTPFPLATTITQASLASLTTTKWFNMKIIAAIIIGILSLKAQQIAAHDVKITAPLLQHYNDNENSVYHDEDSDIINSSRSSSLDTNANSIKMPEIFTCPAEGLYAHNYKCQLYYRCETQTNGYIKAYLLNCKKGTIFSRDLKLCMPAMLANRGECQQYINEIDTSASDDGDVDNIVAEETAAAGAGVINSSIDDNDVVDDDDDDIDSRLKHVLNEAKIKGGIANNGNAMDGAYNHWKNYSLTGLSGVSVISFSTSSARSAGKGSTSGTDNDQGPPCEDDGFMSDPDDCTVFYRCISNGRTFNKIGFRCSDGTAWDELLQSCNHLFNAHTNSKCQGKQSTQMDEYNDRQTSTQSSQSSGQTSTSTSSQQSSTSSSSTSSSSSSTSTSSSSSSSSMSSQESSSQSSSTENSSSSSTSSQSNSSNSQNSHSSSNHNNQQNTSSSNETNSANSQNSNSNSNSQHQNSNQNNDLNSQNSNSNSSSNNQQENSSTSNSSQSNSSNSENSNSSSNNNNQQQNSSGSNLNQSNSTNSEHSNSSGDNNNQQHNSSNSNSSLTNNSNTEVSNSNSNNNNQQQNSSSSNSSQNNSSNSHNSNSSNTDQQQNSSGSNSNQTNNSTSQSSNSNNNNVNQQQNASSSNSSSTQPSITECIDENTYLPDKKDCAKFYRCQRNNNGGSLEIVAFTCGPGTVWNQHSKECDSPTDLQREKCKITSDGQQQHQQQSSSSGNQSGSSSSQSASSSANNQNASSSNNSNQSSTSEQNQSKPQKPSNPDGKCQDSETYLQDKYDCARFYRCVDKGSGSFDIIPFDCAPGTVWDRETKICNHPTNVQKEQCTIMASHGNSTSNNQSNQNSSSTMESNQASSSNQQESSSSSSSNQSSSTASNENSNTAASSSISSSNVNHGSSNEASNSSNNNQNGSSNQSSTGEQQASSHNNNQNVSASSSSSSSSSSSTTESSNSSSSSLENQGSTSTSSSSQSNCNQTNTTQKPFKPATYCESEETFLEDKEDCNKFYRCIDDGKGGLKKVSFKCPPDTVWNPSANSCDHPAQVQNLNCKMTSSTQNSTETSNENSSSSSGVNESSGSQSSSSTSSTSSSNQSSTSTSTTSSSSSSNVEQNHDNQSSSQSGTSSASSSNNQSSGESSSSTTQSSSNNQSATQASASSANNQSSGQSSSSTTQESSDNQSTTQGSASSANNQSSGQSSSSTTQESSNNQSTTQGSESTSSSQSSSSTSTGSSSSSQEANSNQSSSQESSSTTSQGSASTQSGSSSQQSSSTATQGNTITNCNGNNQFLADPKDCAKFYRCIKNSKGGYDKIEFNCGPGTVWDSEIEGCNHAWAVKNKNCGTNSNSQSESEAETQQTAIKPPTQRPPSSTTTTSKPSEQKPTSDRPTQLPTTLKPVPPKPTPAQTTTSSKPPAYGFHCRMEGFAGDPNDCSLFYRCVDNGSGGFTKYSFRCGKGTVWDNELQTCNYDLNKCNQNASSGSSWAQQVTTSEPGYSPTSQKPQATSTAKPGYLPSTQKPHETTTSKPEYPPTTQTSNEITNGPGYESTTQSTQSTSTTKPGYQPTTQLPQETTNKTPEYETVTKPGYRPTTDHPQATDSTTTTKNPNPNRPLSLSDKCSKEGFFGDSQDCQKFYRCVEIGNGSFEKHSFRCGNNTVWDAEIESCNHPANVADAKCTIEATTGMPSTKPTTTYKPTSVTTESAPIYSTTQIPNLPSGTKCEGEGFMADPDNCRKFYRCIKSSGGYERHEFKCSKNTAWNEESQTCDHRVNVDRCQGQTEEPETTTLEYESTTTTEKYFPSTAVSTTETFEKPTTLKPTTSKPSVYPTATSPLEESTSTSYPPPNYTTTMQPTSTTTIPTLPAGKICKGEGFMADPDNCRKFYRCEKSGSNYAKHEFMCAKGTGWNEDKQTCDHRDNIERCQGQSEQTEPNIETTTESTTYKPTASENTTMGYEKPTTTAGYEKPTTSTSYDTTTSKPTTIIDYSTTMQPSSTTPIPTLAPGKKCNGEGFMADPDNCRKFYRCEKSGSGFSRHEFMCAKSTGWNEKKQTCDHRDNIERCQGQTEKPEPETTTMQYTTSEPTSSTISHEKPPTTVAGNEKPTTSTPSYDTTTIWSQKPTITTDFTTTTQSTSTTKVPTLSPGTECNGEGFMADIYNCRKFYRCEKSGNGYSKHEFTCARGTAWNEETQTCDHRDNIARCQGQTEEPEPENTTMEYITSKPTTSEPTTSDYEKPPSTTNGYENPTTTATTDKGKPTTTTEYEKPTMTTTTPYVTTTTNTADYTTTMQPTSTTPAANLPPGKICSGNGFMADPDDCRKFYRCEKSDHGYSKHEFMCAKGTGWSEEKQTCDYRENINRCQGHTEATEFETTTMEYSTHKPTSSASFPTTTIMAEKPSSIIKPTTEPPSSSTDFPSTTSYYTSTTTMQPTSTSPLPNLSPGKKCTGEGFMADPENCRKFYRCTINGGKLEKYEFMCGKGTGWSEDKQTCDHAANIKRCDGQTEATETTTTVHPVDSTTIKTSSVPAETTTTVKPTVTEQLTDKPGYVPSTTYSPTTSESPNITIQSTGKPEEESTSTTTFSTTTEMSTSNPSTFKPTDKPGYLPSTTDSSTLPTTTGEYESTTMEPINHNCTGEGFFPDADDCNRYYRCVDAEKTGKFKVYSFRCPKGTVWDSTIETCNYADKVSGNCSSGTAATQHPSTTENANSSTEKTETTTETSKETTAITTTPSTTTESIDKPELTSTETSIETTTIGKPEPTTTESPKDTTTTTDKPEIPTTNNPKDTTTSEKPEPTTTEYPKDTTTSGKPEPTTTEYPKDTTTSGKPEPTTTEYPKDTTTSGKPEPTTTEYPKDTTTQSLETTTADKDTTPVTNLDTTTTESVASHTTIQPMPSSNTSAPCPPINEGQNLYVCPTGFRRHPKHCNMFYQCTEKADSYDQSIVVFKCPNATVYHDDLNRCDQPKPGEACETKPETALFEEEYKHSHTIQINTTAPLCPNEGHFSLNNNECAELFVKCEFSTHTLQLEGHIFRCPKGFTYWSVSRRCERAQKLQNCKVSKYNVSSSIPVEWLNIGNRRRNLSV